MNQDARHRLENLLDREIEVARALEANLAAEKAALTGNSPEGRRTKRPRKKSSSLGTIEKLETERRALCATPDAKSLSAALAERWRALMLLMAGCRTANEVNGHIIHVRQHQIRQLLDIVRGGAPLTYGPQGKPFAKALRALARA